MLRIARNTLLAASIATASLAVAQMPAGVKTTGGVLTNASGMTLYTFDKDAGEKSVCNAQCAALWPPLAAALELPVVVSIAAFVAVARRAQARAERAPGRPAGAAGGRR